MKILKSWLKDYVDIKVSNQELADKLSLAGNSVESFEENLDKNVVIAEIKEVLPHPNADRLQIAKVFDGKNTLTIVCGAKNIAAGQKVPLAKSGQCCLAILKSSERKLEISSQKECFVLLMN